MQSLAFDVFHYEKEHAVRTLSKIRDVDDVGMLDRSGGARLAFKASYRLALLHVFIAEDIWPDCLYGNTSGDEILITGEIYLTHRPTADAFDKQITGRKQRRTGERVFGLDS